MKLPLKGLVYRLNFGNNYRVDNHFQASQYGYNLQGEAYKEHTGYYDYTIDNILAYNATFGEHILMPHYCMGLQSVNMIIQRLWDKDLHA